MGYQVRCGATTKKGTRCQNKAMVGYSRCKKHQGAWSKPQVKKAKKR
ncbi:HGGxSTG domain-containing protein [Streptomyces hygroscopicus]|nr:HGGxSTG domain-containing protein [Streptomyces hygroscopicus]